jgi:hypothetical protein
VPQSLAPPVALLVNPLVRALNRPVGIEEYLLWSTAAIPLMFLIVAHAGADISLGYPFILLNSLVLLVFNRLKVHRNHLIAILSVGAFSLIGGSLAGTPINTMLSQVVGISVISIYFFSALTVLGPSVLRWMDMYARIAFAVALYGIALWFVARILHTGDGRLKAFYAEPSNFVYTTLPALGYFINCYVAEKRYGLEAAIFILSYLLADSSLGFLGLLLIGMVTFGRRLKGWQVIMGILLACGFVGGIYFASENFRWRVRDTILAISTQDVSKSNGSTYAFLSNAYVTGKAFSNYPLTGVGIGGYRGIYDTYISDLNGIKTTNVYNLGLNQDDANSLFFRTAAELGVPGLICLFVFLIVCARVKGSPYREIRNALLPYMIVRMSRFGAYFSVEVYFFVGLYLLNYLNYRRLNPRTFAQPAAGLPSRRNALQPR